MGWTELFLIISLGFNYWTYGELNEEQVRSQVHRQEAKACRKAISNSRVTELRASDERSKIEQSIKRVSIKSKQQRRSINKMDDSSGCNSTVYPAGTKRVEIIIKRTKDINSEWMRGPSELDE